MHKHLHDKRLYQFIEMCQGKSSVSIAYERDSDWKNNVKDNNHKDGTYGSNLQLRVMLRTLILQ